MKTSASVILLRFRKEDIGLTADIEGMFHQVKIPPEERSFFKFLWYDENNIENPVVDHQMSSYLFGGTSSPGCSNFALKKTGEDNKNQFPTKVIESIKNDFYVDDYLKSFATEEEEISLAQDMMQLCKKGGFHLTKFISNNRNVILAIPEEEQKRSNDEWMPITSQEDTALGMKWNTKNDTLKFQINEKCKPTTKRGLLSNISSIYDPLGIIGPFLLKGRRVMQQACKECKSWDDPLPKQLQEQWIKWKDSIIGIERLSIPRSYKPMGLGCIKETSLNIFSDASDQGFGIGCYIRYVNIKDEVHCSLIYGRSRVAPMKFVAIPRMELTAAVLATKTYNLLMKQLDIDFDEVNVYTDSQVVLGYLNNESRNFKVFVANRIQQIKDLTNLNQGHYVSTKDNPADIASRGLGTNQERKISNWLKGPQFMWQRHIPISANSFSTKEDDVELKKSLVSNAIKKDFMTLLSYLKTRTSSWRKVVRIIMYVLEFIRRVRYQKKENDVFLKMEAQMVILRMVQEESFPKELELMKKNEDLQSTSKIKKLDAFIHTDHLIRVGGRLKNAILNLEEKHPIILPKDHWISESIIRYCHEKTFHGGRGSTLNHIRQNGFWINGANRMTRGVIAKCVQCKKLNTYSCNQKMANLPQERCNVSAPFSYCGIDMFGPFVVKERRLNLKRYCLLFTCLNSCAVHIEVTSDLSTDTFIMALRRFVNRRGNILILQSDNGTNFVGAKNELKKAFDELDKDKIKRYLQDNNSDWITWKFNTPTASNTGGVWERRIRSARSISAHLLDIHGQSMNTESLQTLMTEVEGIINSRPLTVETISDANSLLPISPINLLTMKSKVILPPPGIFEKADLYSRKYWRRIQHISNEFWTRWRKEFLVNLQERQKWFQKRRNFKVDDIVILKEDCERNEWKICRVINVLESNDGVVRTVDLKIGNRNFKQNNIAQTGFKDSFTVGIRFPDEGAVDNNQNTILRGAS